MTLSSWRTATECVQNSALYDGKLGRTEELVHATKLSTRTDSEYKHKLILQIIEWVMELMQWARRDRALRGDCWAWVLRTGCGKNRRKRN